MALAYPTSTPTSVCLGFGAPTLSRNERVGIARP
jgi:hypothetical protein